MRMMGCFGIGSGKIIAENNMVFGHVTGIEKCWWLKINTKSVRRDMLDGAVFPHIIRFTYSVNGTTYQGSRYVSWKAECPQPGAQISVYYARKNPSKYAVKL